MPNTFPGLSARLAHQPGYGFCNNVSNTTAVLGAALLEAGRVRFQGSPRTARGALGARNKAVRVFLSSPEVHPPPPPITPHASRAPPFVGPPWSLRCESCVDLLFVRGAGNCPECGTPLRKSNFRVQLFEDPAVDKEVEIRKKVLKIYNKREEDFSSLRDYNDFLEEVEEIVFNLTNNVDLDNTKKKMEIYQKENKDVIQKNKLKLTREQEELEEALEVERQENEQRRLFVQKEEQLQQILKKKNKQAFLDELESSDLPVALLLAQHKDRSTQLEMQLEKPKPIKPVTFSTGIKMGQHISLAPIQKLEEALYEYHPLQVETCGPQVPEFEMLGRLGYLNHVRAASPQDLAGGYTSSLACHRALQDAFSGLFWQAR